MRPITWPGAVFVVGVAVWLFDCGPVALAVHRPHPEVYCVPFWSVVPPDPLIWVAVWLLEVEPVVRQLDPLSLEYSYRVMLAPLAAAAFQVSLTSSLPGLAWRLPACPAAPEE